MNHNAPAPSAAPFSPGPSSRALAVFALCDPRAGVALRGRPRTHDGDERRVPVGDLDRLRRGDRNRPGVRGVLGRDPLLRLQQGEVPPPHPARRPDQRAGVLPGRRFRHRRPGTVLERLEDPPDLELEPELRSPRSRDLHHDLRGRPLDRAVPGVPRGLGEAGKVSAPLPGGPAGPRVAQPVPDRDPRPGDPPPHDAPVVPRLPHADHDEQAPQALAYAAPPLPLSLDGHPHGLCGGHLRIGAGGRGVRPAAGDEDPGAHVRDHGGRPLLLPRRAARRSRPAGPVGARGQAGLLQLDVPPGDGAVPGAGPPASFPEEKEQPGDRADLRDPDDARRERCTGSTRSWSGSTPVPAGPTSRRSRR